MDFKEVTKETPNIIRQQMFDQMNIIVYIALEIRNERYIFSLRELTKQINNYI